MVRWLLGVVCGPRCDSGTGIGLGCLRRAEWMSPGLTRALGVGWSRTFLWCVSPDPRPIGWSRTYRWCDEHKHAGDVPLVGAQKRAIDA